MGNPVGLFVYLTQRLKKRLLLSQKNRTEIFDHRSKKCLITNLEIALSICPKKTLRQTALLAVMGAFCLGTAFAQSEKLILPDDTEKVERPGTRPNLLEHKFDSLNKRSSVGGVVELPSNSSILTPNKSNKSNSSFDLFGKENNWINNSFDDDQMLSAEAALGVTWLGSTQKGSETGNEGFFDDKSRKNSRNPNRTSNETGNERTDAWQQSGDGLFRSAFGDQKENTYSLDRKAKQGTNQDDDTAGNLFGNRAFGQKSPFGNSFEANSPFGERPPSSVSGVFNNQNLFSPEAKILREKELLKKSEFQKLLNPHSSIAPVTAGFDPLGSLQFGSLQQEVNPVTPKSLEQLTMPKTGAWDSFRESNSLRPTPKNNPFEDFAARNALPGGSSPALIAPASAIMVKPQPGVLEWPKAPR